MTQDTTTQPAAPAADAPSAIAGQDRLVGNVIAGWLGQLVFIAAGFIMPRFIDQSLGTVTLGVWDFAWSLVSYLSLAQAGVSSSIDPFVARYRGLHDTRGLNRVVSSALAIQVVTAVLAAALAVAISQVAPSLLKDRPGFNADEARTVVLLLGLNIAVSFLFNTYGGVIVGCYRQGVYNFINAGSYGLTTLAMIIGLLLGGGLPTLAAASLGGALLTGVASLIAAYAICGELRVRPSQASWSEVVNMLGFGAKTLLSVVSRLLILQTNNMIIMGYLGPAALALYSRPRSLAGQAQSFVSKIGIVLIPTASSLAASGRQGELRDLTFSACRLATYMALPVTIIFVVLGDYILQLWMGPQYDQGLVLAILAVGFLAEMTRQPIASVLASVNKHGRLGMLNLGVSAASVVLGLVMVPIMQWGLLGAALSVAIPLIVVNGLYVPFSACRRLNMNFGRYLIVSHAGPVVCCAPLAASLLVGRWLLSRGSWVGACAAFLAGCVVLCILYWRQALPEKIRQRLLAFWQRPARARRPGAEAVGAGSGRRP